MYLLAHAREPLRLNIGDPWSEANVLTSIKYVKQYGFLETSFTDILDVGPLTADSYRYVHYPPLAEITYGAIGKFLGVSDIATFRLFAIFFSGLAMWLLFQYARRMYSDPVALIATALWSTSLFWLMYADSIHQTPVLQAGTFLGLWGLVRAIETGQRKHVVAAFLGSMACFLTSYDYWLFFPAAVLVTVYVKLGNPLARPGRRFVALCAAGCVAGIVAKAIFVIGAVGWNEFVADVHFQFLERSSSTYDPTLAAPSATIVRRLTLVFSPFFWVPAIYYFVRAVRAPSWSSAIKDGAAWILFTALAFFRLFTQLAASQMLACEVALPFYAIGSALLVARWLDGRRLARAFATLWIVGSAAWGMYVMFTHERSFLEPDDVAQVNAYMGDHDRNDFMLSNLMADGQIQISFERHYWQVPDGDQAIQAYTTMLSIFERTGAEYVHAAIFNTPESRFIDKSLWPIAAWRRQWSVTGWPHLWRRKTNGMIREADRWVQANLSAMKAKKLATLSNFDLYRIDRSDIVDKMRARVPVTRMIDFGSFSSERYKLLGWSGVTWSKEEEGVVYSQPVGRERCPEYARPSERNACPTVLTKRGVDILRKVQDPTAQFMIRVERACDLQLRIRTVGHGVLRVEMNGFEKTESVSSSVLEVVVPESAVQAGVNVVSLQDKLNLNGEKAVGISTVEIEPLCSR
ncbi:MAG TPA: glycosyltransferase family 39 protein [Kofleriaceae bacterium]|nr:glycosyltransferase family 39 protein [Kofleriaceae bacterium]